MDKYLALLNSGAVLVPWPLMFDGSVIDCSVMPIHPFCAQKCKSRECVNFRRAGQELVCENGLTYYQLNISGRHAVVYGVVGEDRTEFLKKSKEFRNQSKGRSVRIADIVAWASVIKRAFGTADKIESEAIAQALHPLHDTIKWAEQIYGIVEKLLTGDQRNGIEESLDQAPREMKTLFKASQMLVGTFETLTIYTNPESASFGKKRPVELYKLLHKLTIILNTVEAADANKFIVLSGRGYNKYYLYESFSLLPMALIQNAVKYSQAREVEVKVDEDGKGATVSITSVGPEIDSEEMKSIFNRGTRGKWARLLHHQGMGVGLYVAKIVADAHHMDIKVNSESLGYSSGSIPQAKNEFSFRVALRDQIYG